MISSFKFQGGNHIHTPVIVCVSMRSRRSFFLWTNTEHKRAVHKSMRWMGWWDTRGCADLVLYILVQGDIKNTECFEVMFRRAAPSSKGGCVGRAISLQCVPFSTMIPLPVRSMPSRRTSGTLSWRRWSIRASEKCCSVRSLTGTWVNLAVRRVAWHVAGSGHSDLGVVSVPV